MFDLASDVLRFLASLKKANPSAASSPEVNRLTREAATTIAGSQYGLVAPASPEDWNVEAFLPGASVETGPNPIRFGRPVLITGFNPVVRPIFPVDPLLGIPTIDDITVQIVIENERNITQGTGGQTKIQSAQFSNLSDFAIFLPRLIMRRLRTGDPAMTFNFRWAQPPNPSGAVFNDCRIRMGVFTRYLRKAEIEAEWRDAQELENPNA